MAFSPESLHSSLHCHIAQNLALFWRDNNYVLYRLHSVYAFIHFNGHPPIKASSLLFVAGTVSGVAGVQLNYRGPFFLRVCLQGEVYCHTVSQCLLHCYQEGPRVPTSPDLHQHMLSGFMGFFG